MEHPDIRGPGRFDAGRAAFWSATWALGVAIGVALGGWLTVVGGSGVPGSGSLDITHDLIVLPLISGAAVFAGLFIVRLLVALLRRHAS